MSRWLVIAAISAALAWAGYWWIGARAHEVAWTTWLEERVEDGWRAEFEDLSVRGFPNRFDTAFTDLRLADPHRDWSWHVPRMAVLALSYRPTEVIAVWPEHQTIEIGDQTLGVTADTLKASISVSPTLDLPVERMILEAENLALVSTTDAQTRLSSLIATLTREEEALYDAGFEAKSMSLPAAYADRVKDVAGLPKVFERLRLRTKVQYDRPWDRPAIEGLTPALQHMEVTEFVARWGKLDLRATGDLRFDTSGVPSGHLDLRAENWRQMLPLLTAAGVIPEAMQSTVETGLGLLARLSGNADTLDVPLTISSGEMRLGPVPLGPFPQLWP